MKHRCRNLTRSIETYYKSPQPTVLTYVPTEYPHKRNDPRTRQILWQEHEVGQIVRQAERDLRASPCCTDDERKKRYMNLGSGAAHFTTNRKSGSEERLRTVTRLRPPPSVRRPHPLPPLRVLHTLRPSAALCQFTQRFIHRQN